VHLISASALGVLKRLNGAGDKSRLAAEALMKAAAFSDRNGSVAGEMAAKARNENWKHYSRGKHGLGPLSRLAKTHARSSTVLVDEFNARRFKGAPNDILSSPTRLTAVSFELMDSHHSHAGAIGQHLLAPA